MRNDYSMAESRINPGGYIKAYRKTLKSDMYQSLTASQRDTFWVCLLLANHSPRKWEWNGEIFTCRPGQFITSLESIKKLCAPDTSIQKIRTALLKLEKWQFLTSKSTKRGRLITITNWGVYQANDFRVNKESNSQITNSQQLTRSNKNEKNTYTADFERFWGAYPRKVGKRSAFTAWQKSNGTRPSVEDLISAINAQCQSTAWKKEGGQFIPYPATWINGRRWEDEVTTPSTQSAKDSPPYWQEVN